MARTVTALVINPCVTDFKLYDEWMHPLGLYLLIDTLVANGIDVHYLDALQRPPAATAGKFGTVDATVTSSAAPAPAVNAHAPETALPQGP